MYFYENFFVPWRWPGHLFKSEKVGGPVSGVQDGFQISSLRSPCEYRGVCNGPSCASATNRRERETAGQEDAEWAGWVLSNVWLDREGEESGGVHQRSNAHPHQNDRRHGQPEMCEQQVEDHQQTGHEQIINMAFSKFGTLGNSFLTRDDVRTPTRHHASTSVMVKQRLPTTTRTPE